MTTQTTINLDAVTGRNADEGNLVVAATPTEGGHVARIPRERAAAFIDLRTAWIYGTYEQVEKLKETIAFVDQDWTGGKTTITYQDGKTLRVEVDRLEVI